ncbi:MAG: VPLPA-CTERM sorting domain-containing protein, partial [Rhodobacteraceae bacterium]|nr:VPLPA-CTERM sorting domain-containing protein [Paracoccaceae bacterium]
NFVAESETATFEFAAAGRSKFGYGPYATYMSVDDIGIAEAPLPAGVVLVLTGIAAFGAMRYRGRA